MAAAGRIGNAIVRVNRRCALRLAAVVVLLGGAHAAHAHPEWSPIRVNRYCKLVLAGPGELRLVYTILYGEGPALAVRKAADANADGRLDAAEQTAIGARARALVAAGLALTLDGRRLAARAEATDVGLAGDDVAPQPLSIDLTVSLPAGAGPHELIVDDRVAVPSEGDAEVSVDERGPAMLRAFTHRASEAAPGRPRTFKFVGARSLIEDRSVTLRFEVPSDTGRGRTAVLALGIAAGLALGIAFAIRARRQRSMKG